MLTAWVESCNLHPAGLEVARPLAQFAAGLLACLALRLLPRAPANLHCFLWLYMVFDLFVSSGHVLFSGLTDFGDAAALIAGLTPPILWRGLLVLLGGVVYYLSMRTCGLELRRFAGSDNGNARLNRFVWIPYLAAGVLACCSGALNTTMPPMLELELAAASSFGGAFGLVRLPDLQRGMVAVAAQPAVYVKWSSAWGLAAAQTIVIFITMLGPGLTWAGR